MWGIPDCSEFCHLVVEDVIPQVGEHVAGFVEPVQRIAFLGGATAPGEHVGNDAEAVHFKGCAQRRQFRGKGSVNPSGMLGPIGQ